MNQRIAGCFAAVVGVAVLSAAVCADEGMWLLNHPPTKILKEKYGFEPTPQWLEHVQKSCVRFGRGGSASILSSEGLVMTNHHVGEDQLHKHSTADRDLLVTGFYAKTRDEEIKCDDLELRILWSIEDVTDKVNAGAAEGMSSADAETARRSRIAQIEKESLDTTKLASEVVTLYHGGRYHLYRYKRYTDIRLVMAPEMAIASFGGDTDNFEYPRYDLDVSFFRIYEDGKPLKAEHFLKWSANGAADGDLTFVVGHPGRTQRLFTIDHLNYLAEVEIPTILRRLWRAEVKLQGFSARSAEQQRMASSDLGYIQNSRKAFMGILEGLYDPELMRTKNVQEREIRSAVGGNEQYKAKWGGAWHRIAEAEKTQAAMYERYSALEGRRSVLKNDLYMIAKDLVRLAAEKAKPNGERMEEFQDAALDDLYLSLYSQAPIYDELEIALMNSGLSYLVENFGLDDPLVKAALGGQSPLARAQSLVKGTKLKDVAERKRLAEGGAKAIEESTDPMIRFAAAIDPIARALRKERDDKVESVEHEAYAKIAAAQFAIKGEEIYPDATFTLRLSFGPIKGFEENGKQIAPFTDFAGLYERAKQRGGIPPFELPKRWIERKDKLDLKTPFNFVCTADIIGGNSGSPVINRQGEFIGIVFDGNLQSLIWDIAFTEVQGRSVAVDSRGIIEALRKVYDANALADELMRGT